MTQETDDRRADIPSTRPITIYLADSGESFEFDPPDDLWFDMLAFCDVAGLTLQELITQALSAFLPEAQGDRPCD